MRILNLFTKNEAIGGLEISETHLRMVVLGWKNKKLRTLKIKKIKEVPLPAGIIQKGRVVQADKFTKTLKNLLKNMNGLRYVIPSLPPNDVYFHLYSFPSTIKKKELEKTMELTVGFQLPVDPETSYLDWEKANEEKNEISLATIPKRVINDYIDAFREAGLNVVAVEFHSLSLVRSLDTTPDKVQVVRQKLKNGTTLSVIEGRDLKFVRFLPKNRVSDKQVAQESDSVGKFYAAKSKITPVHTEHTKLSPLKSFLDNETVAENPSKWIIALGAAIRGIIPPSQDDLISLMPVGTEEAYQHQKMRLYVGFWSNLTVGLSIFFIAAFISVWLLMVSLQERSLAEIEILTPSAPNKELGDIRARTLALNAIIKDGISLMENMPRWKNIMTEIEKHTTSGIIIHSLSFPSPSSTITIRGASLDRPSLIAYKASLEDSSLFLNINLPIDNISLSKNIPFVISFTLSDPTQLYITP